MAIPVQNNLSSRQFGAEYMPQNEEKLILGDGRVSLFQNNEA